MLLAYFGPETMLPITSAVAGVVGFFMMFGRQISAATRRLVRRLTGAIHRAPSSPKSVPGRPAGRRVRSDAAPTTASRQ